MIVIQPRPPGVESLAIGPNTSGLGRRVAVEAWRGTDPARLAKLQTMYREWPFFSTLLSNAQMALYKADMNIAGEYARLCLDKEAGARIFDLIRHRHQSAVRQILHVADVSTLLEETPELAISLAHRNPYLDPLNHIQAVALDKLRRDQEGDNPWLEPLLRSSNAIAAGMRHTGLTASTRAALVIRLRMARPNCRKPYKPLRQRAGASVDLTRRLQ